MSAPTPLSSHEAVNKIVEVADTTPVIAGAHFDSARLMQLLEQLLIELRLHTIYLSQIVNEQFTEEDIEG